jgi:hypothetical protein
VAIKKDQLETPHEADKMRECIIGYAHFNGQVGTGDFLNFLGGKLISTLEHWSTQTPHPLRGAGSDFVIFHYRLFVFFRKYMVYVLVHRVQLMTLKMQVFDLSSFMLSWI